ncbi:hypothetical protein FACS1894178_7190 [Bacteroidia bacterium]|nr:hypothetical protein FACS1894178_7190 [Bacteroidia bacterium]
MVIIPPDGIPDEVGITIAVLESYQFSVEVNPVELAKEVVWSVANNQIATIDKNGLATGIGKGTTFVRATVGTYTVGFVINVTPFYSLTLEKHNLVAWMGAAGEQKLNYTAVPESAMSESVSWTSSDESIAKVSTTGVITAIASGDVTIIANGAGKIDSCAVTVMGATVSPSHAWLNVNGQSSITVDAFTSNVPSPGSATISYSSDNTSIATISASGVISAIASGSTNIKTTITVPTLDPVVYEREVIVFNSEIVTSVSGVDFKMMKIDGNNNNGIADFFMGVTEVTQDLWYAVMGNYPHAQDKGVGNDFPVYYVSWYDAVQFCNELSTLAGKTPYYNIATDVVDPNNSATSANDPFKWLVTVIENANGFRLPTEAEWLHAARGAAYSHNYSYSGSNVLPDVAWFSSNAGGNTHEVGTKDVNELGLYDMNGNVKEWCFDWFSADGVGHGSSGANRTARGGAYNEALQQIFLTDRPTTSALNAMIYGAPGKNDVKFGLRIICPVP